MGEQAERWRRMVQDRLSDPRRASPGTRRDEVRLEAYAREVAATGAQDPFLDRVLERAVPAATVLDVGAGSGRFALPLARQGRRVIAVEPNEQMCSRLERRAAAAGLADSIRVVRARWQDVDPARVEAQVAICAYVLPRIPVVVPFLRRLDAAASEHVLVYLDAALDEELPAGTVPPPTSRELLAVLEEAGLGPVSLEVVDRPTAPRARWRMVPGAIVSWPTGRQ